MIGPDDSVDPDGRPRTSRPVDRPASRTKRSGRKVALDPYVVAALVTHHGRQIERAAALDAVLPKDRLSTHVGPGRARRAAAEQRYICPETGRQRLGYDRARTLIKGYTGLALHHLRHSAATHLEALDPSAG